MTNIVIVRQSFKNYLFSVPMGTMLKKDDKVVCDTARGEQEGICFTDSFIVEADALKQIALLTGATLPLKSVIGKSEIVRFKDKPQENELKFKERDCITWGRIKNGKLIIPNKFKVGEKYTVGKFMYYEGGNVIEITDIIGEYCHYQTIAGKYIPEKSATRFAIYSPFADYLTPYTEPTKHVYKKGDYVKIISNKKCDFEVGYIVKLNYKANNGWWDCTWTGFDDSLTSYVSEDEFEPFEMGGIK